jgi:hypothetical protein
MTARAHDVGRANKNDVRLAEIRAGENRTNQRHTTARILGCAFCTLFGVLAITYGIVTVATAEEPWWKTLATVVTTITGGLMVLYAKLRMGETDRRKFEQQVVGLIDEIKQPTNRIGGPS